MTLAELVAAIQEEHDATSAQVERWANQRYRRMVSESKWRMVERSLGSTVAGTDVYAVDADMLELERLSVGGVEYGRTGTEQMWAVKAGRARLVGGGVFCAGFATGGTPQVRLYPAPSVTGLELLGLMVFVPDALTSSDEPVFPESFHSFWEDGVIADAYERLDGRHELAGPHEQRFVEGIAALARTKVSRIGGGAVQAPLPRR